MRRVMGWMLTSVACLLAACAAAAAKPGDPDVDFGGTGTVFLAPLQSGFSNPTPASVAVDDTDRVVLALNAAVFQGVTRSEGYVERLRPDGGVDGAFKAQGGIDLSDGGVAVAPTDLVFAAADNPPTVQSEWLVGRVNGASELSELGILLPGDRDQPAPPPYLLLQDDGEDVLGASVPLDGSLAIGLARGDPLHGGLDRSFSFDGEEAIQVPGSTSTNVTGLACATPGSQAQRCGFESRLLVSGETITGGMARNFVARFNTDGTIDRTFAAGKGAAILGVTRVGSSTGSVSIPVGAQSLAVDSRGRPVIGIGRDIERLNPDGTPDSTFGSDSVVSLDPQFQVIGLVTTPQDGVLALDGPTDVPGGAYQLRRFSSSGRPDGDFGNRFGVAPVVGTTAPTTLALTHDAKILVAGISTGSPHGTTGSVTRFLDVAISPPILTSTPRAATISFTLTAPEAVGIFVQRRLHGRLITVGRVPLGRKRPGHHRVVWRLRVHKRRLAPGVYYIRLRLLDSHGRPFEVTKLFRIRVRARS